MPSIFTKIINREIPAHIVYETDRHIAILDVNPNSKGHTLCIPKKEADKIFDLKEEEYLDLMSFSRKVALALGKTVPCKRVGISVIGLEVPHVHVHLIPLQKMDDARFDKKVDMAEEEMKKLAGEINDNII